MVSHGHTLSRLFIYTISLTFNEADRFMTATPLYFGGARYMTMAYLFMGATVVLYPPPFEVGALAQAVNDKRVTSLFLVPTLLRRLMEMPKSSLPAVSARAPADRVGIEPLPQERRTHHARALSGTSSISTAPPKAAGFRCCGPSIRTRPRCRSGRWCSAPKCRSSTSSTGRCRPERSGRSATAAAASPTATTATRRRARWRFATAGTIRAISEASTQDGFLYLTGRSKDMIIRGGVNIYPVEIEQTLVDRIRRWPKRPWSAGRRRSAARK